jgi:outer membrane protein assembly factor BamD
MKFLTRILLLLLIITLSSCSKDEKKVSFVKENTQEQEMISAYKEGIKYLNDGDAFYAAKSFLNAELLFPQSDWAPKSALMAAYSYYIQDYFYEAILNLERFLKTYPEDERIYYAHYLLAMCHYEKIEGEKKDLQPLIEAKKEFEFVIKNYPNSDFAIDSRFKIDLINDVLAAKEMYIGRHYIKKEKWIPAINRFKNVLESYERTIYIEEAIHRLVEIYYKIGLESEANKYAILLGYNYQSSKWYEKTYKIFNKKYKKNQVKNIQEDKKKKNNLIKKIKKFF